MQPTLDVIIPCYNAENTLRAAAESALAQSVVQTVWLVDDASEDGTPDIMRELAAQYPQIRCEYLPSNGGAARARNWGALQSRADFTAFLDADDAYEVSALLPAYTALSRFTYLSLVRLKLRPVGFPNRYLTHPDFNRAWQQLEMTVGGNTVFRRNTLLACGGFPQDEIFRTFGGEDAALGIALTRSSVVGTLFGEQDAAVHHTYRPNIHAEACWSSHYSASPIKKSQQNISNRQKPLPNVFAENWKNSNCRLHWNKTASCHCSLLMRTKTFPIRYSATNVTMRHQNNHIKKCKRIRKFNPTKIEAV